MFRRLFRALVGGTKAVPKKAVQAAKTYSAPGGSRLKRGSKILAIVIASVGASEGLRTQAYLDPVGIPTVCYGETRGVSMGDKYTVEQCKVMLGDRLLEFEQNIRKCLKFPDEVPDGAYVASLSLAYNIGSSAFCRSSYVRLLNEKKWKEACPKIKLWNKAGGRVLRGLVKRRQEEYEFCMGQRGI